MSHDMIACNALFVHKASQGRLQEERSAVNDAAPAITDSVSGLAGSGRESECCVTER